LGEPRVSWSDARSGGTGGPQALAGVGGFAQSTSPSGTPQTHSRGPGTGERATSEATREGHGGRRSGASYLGRWGTQAHRTHWREGATGPHVELERPTGDTWSSLTVTPQLPRIAAQAARASARPMTVASAVSGKRTLRSSWASSQSGVPVLACAFIPRRRRWSSSGSPKPVRHRHMGTAHASCSASPLTGHEHVGGFGASNAEQPGNGSGAPRRRCGTGVATTVMRLCHPRLGGWVRSSTGTFGTPGFEATFHGWKTSVAMRRRRGDTG
jgi:hypothetical protein